MATLAELIKEHCGDLGQDYPAIAARLNAPTEVANPDAGKSTTVTTPAPITLKMVMAAVPPAEMAGVYASMPAFSGDLKTAIDAGDRDYMAWLLQIAMQAKDAEGTAYVSQQTAGTLAGMLAQTVTATTVEPTTVAGPSLAAAAGLGVVTERDVQAALN